MSTKKLTLFLLLFLQSAVVAFAQQDLRLGLNPNGGSWYSEGSRDAAYESTLKQLQRTWIPVSGSYDCSLPQPTVFCNLKSVTFKPNGLGSIAFNRESYLLEVPFTYTKKNDKITISINYLRTKVSSTISKEELDNLSQRRKDNIERTRNEYLVDARKRETVKHTLTMYRIDDYLVLHGEFYSELGGFDETSVFVSKEYQAIIDEKAAAKAKAEEEAKRALYAPWDKRVKEIYAAPYDSTVYVREDKKLIDFANKAYKYSYGKDAHFEETVLPKYEFSPDDVVIYRTEQMNGQRVAVYLNNEYHSEIIFAKENGIWKIILDINERRRLETTIMNCWEVFKEYRRYKKSPAEQ